MCDITLSVPDETLRALNLSRQELADELRMLAAVKLFELERLSSGAAAELAGISRPVFLSRLAAYNVPTFRLTETELEDDLNNA